MRKNLLYLFLCTIPHLWGCKKESSTQSLEQQYQVIKKMAAKEACNDGANWRIAPIGAKACGGPTGYIAYSTRIDTAAFLQKVAEYTEAQRRQNKEKGLFSDCSITIRPRGVQCVNGGPEFYY